MVVTFLAHITKTTLKLYLIAFYIVTSLGFLVPSYIKKDENFDLQVNELEQGTNRDP